MKIITIVAIVIVCILLYLILSFLADRLIAAIQKRRKVRRNVTQNNLQDQLAGDVDCVTDKNRED